MSIHKRVRQAVWASVASTAVFVSCVDEQGGLNQNERTAGNGDNGVSVGFGEIAIDPTGTFLVSSSQQRLVYGDLASGDTRVLSGLSGSQRVAFDHAGRTLFVTRGGLEGRAEANVDDDGLHVEADLELEAGKLVRYDTQTGKQLWSRDVDLGYLVEDRGLGTYPWIDVTNDDALLVLTYFDRVELVSAADGKLLHRSQAFASGIVDVDLTPDQKRLLITLDHAWDGDKPRTELVLLDVRSFRKTTLEVPNCADELLITPNGKYALLAPTTCQPEPDVNKDPVSVIDLERNVFVRNLPGFGPVALAPNGALGIAFIDMENVDAGLFDDPKQIPSDDVRFHLMLIDTKTLRFDTVELGDALPRYAVSPDGKLLLVDSPTLWDDGRIRVLDVQKRELVAVKGPNIRLDNYVVTRDSSKVFLLDEGLFRIVLSTRRVEAEAIDFTPTHLNITPDDSTLVLREDDRTLWLYDAHAGESLRAMHIAD